MFQWIKRAWRWAWAIFAVRVIGRPPPEPEDTPADKLPVPNRQLPEEIAIENMITELFAREGGYCNVPQDRGGPTKYGVTQRTLSAWRKGPCSEDDVRCLTKHEARDIYLKEFFNGPRISDLPYGIRAHVFDIAVNSGPQTAIKLLQRALNALGSELKEDGIIGPMTLGASRYRNPDEINKRIVHERLAFYDAIVKRRPDQVIFLNGWRNRAKHFLPQR